MFALLETYVAYSTNHVCKTGKSKTMKVQGNLFSQLYLVLSSVALLATVTKAPKSFTDDHVSASRETHVALSLLILSSGIMWCLQFYCIL